MPVVGMVLTFSEDRAAAAAARAWLAGDPRYELGPQAGRRLAAVLDTPDRTADAAAWEELKSLPGVLAAEPVYVDFSDCTAPGAGLPIEGT